MLPATGLFRSINCPFFEKDLCTRAYCHFKHIKSEVPAAATYSATPKSILNRTSNERPDITGSDVPAKKKPKLEYIPMPTVIAPKYVPSVKAVPPITEELTRNESAVEIPAIKKLDSSIKADNTEPTCEIQPADGEHNKSNVEHNEANKEHNEDGRSRNGYNKIEIIAKDNDINPTELSAATTISSEKESTESSVAATVEKDKPIERSSSRKSSSSHTSSSSHKKSSREDKHHRRHESSSKTEKKTSSSRSHTSDRKHSSSSRNEERVSNSKTEIKDKHREKTHEKSKSREKCRESDRRSSRDTNSSSKSDQNRHRSSHSSTKSRTKSCSISKHTDKSSKSTKTETKERKPSSTSLQSSSSKSKLALADKIYLELLDNPPSDIDGESDEDEVMKQCKMIFEEYDSTSSKISDHEKPKTVQSQKPELIDMFAEKYYDENRKKRVAHENVSNVKSSSSIPVTKKPNHVQNAMRSVYHRQEIVRKQQEELAAKIRLEEEAKARIEEETRKAISKPVTPRLSNGSPRSPVVSPTSVNTLVAEKSPVSPINTTSFYNKSPDAIAISMTPKSRFAPAVNVLALQKAKEKIEELKKLKGISTPAQTAPKGLGRKAHVGSVLPESASSSSSSAVPSPSKPAPPVLEPESTKISYNIRMQFYNLMVQHCVSIYSSLEDAWDRAQTEELSVLKKCNTPMIYKKSALLTVNKLRKEAGELGNKVADRNKTVSHDVILAGKMGQNISWSVNKKIKTEVKSAYTIDNAPSTVAYKMIYECIMTEEQLQSNGFPRATEITGQAKIFTSKPRRPPNEDERYCSRCSKVYNLESYDEPAVDSCNYHNKSTCYRRGFADNLHSCCQQPSGSAGCMYANYHVTSYMDYDNLTGFVKTMDPPEGYVPSKKDVYALDCEMCYTTAGLELTRVTVVDINEKTVYDTLVKPSNRVIDYNTRFSGITEQMLIDITTNLYNVQAVLLSMFNSETILIGHSLESDFKALKLIHDTVVDTSILYPHKMGPPKKRALKTLCIENLKKIIQENDAGHDSAEDSVVCIQLIKHYLSNRIL